MVVNKAVKEEGVPPAAAAAKAGVRGGREEGRLTMVSTKEGGDGGESSTFLTSLQLYRIRRENKFWMMWANLNLNWLLTYHSCQGINLHKFRGSQ